MINSNLQQTINLQQTASDPRNSAWVFASAGSGKTKILTNRVLRLLLEDVKPSKILCLTFTKNAATEMQQRINEELARWTLCNEEELSKKLHDLTGYPPQKNTIKKAQILFNKILDEEFKIKTQTIHSFCQSLIKIFPFEAGIKPNFEIIEKTQETLLLKEAQQQLLREANSFNSKNKSKEDLRRLIIKINSNIDEESFSKLVSELLQKKEKLNSAKEKFFGIENLVEEIYKKLSISPHENEQDIIDNFVIKSNAKEVLELAKELSNSSIKLNLSLSRAIEKFYTNPLSEDFIEYYEAFFTEKNEPRKLSKKTLENFSIKSLIEKQQNLIAEFFDKLNSFKICNNSALLLKFVDKILENYLEIKKQNSLLDYNDLIATTNKLLANKDFSEWVKLKMDGSFDHILIDESQDTNHQQWNIVKALTDDFFSGLSSSNKNRSIFIVGDEKQSIYSFQGSEINISEEIFDYFAEKSNHQLKKISLNNSFRSLSTILDAVDQIFSQENIKKSISKISDFQPHLPIRQGIGKFEIWPQIKSEKIKEKNSSLEWNINFLTKEKYDEKDKLAKIIATKIKNWVNNKRIISSKNRAVEYSDFMILLRKRTGGFNQSLIKYFNEYKIPFSTSGKIKLSENLLLQDLLCCAKFALLKEDDLNLACLLKSPIFNLLEEDLFEICLIKNQEGISIYKALSQIKKFDNIKNDLDEIIFNSLKFNAFEFFYSLIEEKNNRQKIISYFGQEASQIIDKFLILVNDFCRNFSTNLQKFLEFVEEIDPEILLNSSKNNAVKISTVHSAKGLQSSIVIMPDCCYNFNQLLSTKEKIIWLDELPIYLAKKEQENKIIKLYKKTKLQEVKDEYLRLFYVAMTRAEDELYIGGFGDSKDQDSWYEIAARFIPQAVISLESLEDCLKQNVNHESVKKKESFQIKNNDNFLLPKNINKIIKTEKNRSQISSSQIRGKLIHKILEIFGKNHSQPKEWLMNLAKKLIEKEEFLSLTQKEVIADEILQFLDSSLFQEIFCGEIKCEFEIVAKINDENLLLRIDLIKITDNEVIIIDFKSDEILPQTIPIEYLEQLNLYKNSIKNIYPNKKISCAILWIKFCRLEFAII